MEIEAEEEAIWGVEEMVYYGTCLSGTRSRQEDEDRDGYVRLCYRRSIVNEI